MSTSAGGASVVAEFELRLSQAAVQTAMRDAAAASQKIAESLASKGYFKVAGEKISAEVKKGLDRGSLEDWARDSQAKLARALEFARADIKRFTAKGIITKQEAEEQGNLAGLAFNRGLLGVIKSAGDRGAFAGQGGGALYTALASSLQKVKAPADGAAASMRAFATAEQAAEQATARLPAALASTSARAADFLTGLKGVTAASINLGAAQERLRLGIDPAAAALAKSATVAGAWTVTTRQGAAAAAQKTASLGGLRSALVQMAIQETGATGGAGRLVSALLVLGAGSGVVLAIAAGVALIAAGYNKLTAAAREAKQQTAELIKSLIEAARLRRVQEFGPTEDADTVRNKLNTNTATLNRLREQDDGAAKAFAAQVASGRRAKGSKYYSPFRKELQIALDERKELQTALNEVEEQVRQVEETNEARRVARAAKRLQATRVEIKDRQEADGLLAKYRTESQRLNDRYDERGSLSLRDDARLKQVDDYITALQNPEDRAAAKGKTTAATEARRVETAATRARAVEKDTAAFLVQLQAQVSRTTTLLVDNALAALDQFEQDVAAKLSDPKIPAALKERIRTAAAGIRSTLQQQVETAAFLDASPKLTAGASGDSYGQLEHKYAAIGDEIARVKTYLHDNNIELSQSVPLTARLAELESQRAGTHDKILASHVKENAELEKQITKGADAVEKLYAQPAKDAAERTKHAREMARSIQDATRGALELAKAFGGVSEQTKQVLTNIGNAAGDAIKLSSAITNYNTKDASGKRLGSALSAGTSALALAGSAVGIVSGILGESPEEKARKQALLDNTQAIKDLAARIVEVNLTGLQQSQAGGALAAFNKTSAGRNVRDYRGGIDLVGTGNEGNDFTKQLTEAAATVGLSFERLSDIARGYGITLDGTAESIQKFDQAVKLASTSTLRTYGGRLDAIQTGFLVNGITDADQQLIQTVGLLMSTSPVFSLALRGIDLSTAAGRAQARTAIQAVYARATEPKGRGLSGQELGGLTGSQAVDAIVNLTTLLNSSDSADPNALTNRSLASVSQITTGGADMITSQLGTSNAFLAQIAASTAQMAGQSTPPTLSLSFQPGAIAVDVDGSVTVNPSLVDAVNISLGGTLNRQAGNYGTSVLI